MPLGDGTKFAGYTIERQLGAGGMGEVYLAQHPRLPRHDALKVLRSDISSDPDYVERFNREADLASKLWHPHIVGIHDRGKYRGRLWISMDFVDGIDAGRLLQDYPDGMPRQDVLVIVTAVSAALDYAHGMNLLHRDVKPANILISDAHHGERRILLTDFGVARDLTDTASGSLTATNMTVGTAAYAAPEQLMGLDLDGRADQYSLAATAYHLLTGVQLFQHSNPAVVIGKHLNEEPPRISWVRSDLRPFDEVLARALAKSPDERFTTCTDFARALEQSLESDDYTSTLSPNAMETMVAPVATPPPPATPMVSAPATSSAGTGRKLIGVAVISAVVLAAVAVVAYFALQPTDEESSAEPFTIAGKVRLTDLVKTTGLPSGYKCAGAGDYGDISPNAPIIVEDESGKLLAKGSMLGSSSDRDGCLLRFHVSDVPAGAQFYRVQVGQHEMSYTEQEAKAGVELVLGTMEPDPTTAAPPPTPPPTRTVTVTPTPDVEKQSLARLQAIARDDRPSVSAMLADRWIPQISSKRVGLVANGITWDNEAILNEHLRLRSMYPDVKLLWSGDWSTYDGRNFWVTVVGLWSDNPYDVLGWCVDEGFDRDNCIAKIVSTTHPIAGSTKLMPG
ncbi:serine/threonine protein kinase [Mycolicibacterium elephantis]|uniref:serine/threonine-protein kinase n=1 Tax=Mycolicibacterium elephantis TaxID=81858 RepID=UPI000FE21674|nr:serine/threonine-protein kinase [Mycolicibacterium elephantis]MCV7220810.1 serine/threonine protein kinase [Mycolicibacterium elephantis]